MRVLLRNCLLAFVLLGQAATQSWAAEVEVAFSPGEGAQELVLKTIHAAQSDIKVMAYVFTLPAVTRALVEARHRGVDVSIVADSSNLENKVSMAALSSLYTAGVHIRIVSVYKILHDKVIIIDGKTVQTGSFNYTKSAVTSNSENVIVLWAQPDIAARYTAHWQDRWDIGKDFKPAY